MLLGLVGARACLLGLPEYGEASSSVVVRLAAALLVKGDDVMLPLLLRLRSWRRALVALLLAEADVAADVVAAVSAAVGLVPVDVGLVAKASSLPSVLLRGDVKNLAALPVFVGLSRAAAAAADAARLA